MKKIQFSVVNLIISILFSLACVFGFSAKNYGEIKFGSAWTYVAFLGVGVVSYFLVSIIWNLIDKYMRRRGDSSFAKVKENDAGFLETNSEEKDLSGNKSNNTGDNKRKKVWLKSTLTIWLLNFVVFLGVYPGFFCYDAQDELMETITRSFNNQHPMLHVLSMGGILQFFHKITGNYNLGIAAFILFQMTIIAIVLGFLIKVMSDEGLGKKGQIALSIYFGVFPVLVMYSLCSSKDGVFGAFLVLSVIKLKQLIESPKQFFGEKKVKNIVLLTLSLILMMLMRNNGVYAFTVFTLIFIIAGIKNTIIREYIKRIILIFLAAIVSYLAINTTLLKVTDYKDVGHKEILTVPIQQMARIFSFDKSSLTDDEIMKISEYIPEEALLRYDPKCSDMVKVDFNEDNYLKNPGGFYEIWLSLGVKHPAAYINALVMTSYGLYYPWAIIDGYKDHEMFTYTYGDSSYFGYEVEPPGERSTLIPLIDDFYRWLSLDVKAQEVPVLHLLLSPGFMLWIYVLLIGYMIDSHSTRRRNNTSVNDKVLEAGRIKTANPAFGMEVYAFILPLTVILTCLIGPMSLVRYSFYLWIFVPMIIHVIVKENK